MLLIGSRALRYHFPEFRQPVDWDLVGSRDEAERLAKVLEAAPVRSGARGRGKLNFRYDGALVEFALTDEKPYWQNVVDTFRDEPTMEDAVLGRMTIPPASFLMLTKQCGLIYRINFWHKNLEDLYYLRNLIPEIPDKVAALLPAAQADSASMFAERHVQVAREPFACHPQLPDHPDQDLHKLLHDRFRLGSQPLRETPGAWKAFVDKSPEERTELMIQLLAEEAMVLAAHEYVATDRTQTPREPRELIRFAVRALIVSGLPEAWRYFGVNHYREIMESIPASWGDDLCSLDVRRPSALSPCTDEAADAHNLLTPY
jgi:hypothetical protein